MFHISTIENLNKIEDELFKARRWDPIRGYPHTVLRQASLNLQEGHSIYRFCFYVSHDRALRSQENDFAFSENHMLRFNGDVGEMLSYGFNESWDDGFNDGEVYLFWCSAPTNPTSFSEIGIPLNRFSIYINGQWQPLEGYFSEKGEHNKGAIQNVEPPVNEGTNSSFWSWLKSWANKALQRTSR